MSLRHYFEKYQRCGFQSVMCIVTTALSEEFTACYTKSTTLVVSTEVLSLLPKRSSLALAKQRVTGGSDGEERVKLQCCHIKQPLPTIITGLRLCRVRSADMMIRTERCWHLPARRRTINACYDTQTEKSIGVMCEFNLHLWKYPFY